MPTTVADYDRELEETKKKMARLKEGRKAAAAREREQNRKWRSSVTSAMGEMLLDALGFDWNEVDLAGLRPLLDELVEERRDDIRLCAVAEGRTPAEAKQALDSFKKASRTAKKAAPEQSEPQQEPNETESASEDTATW